MYREAAGISPRIRTPNTPAMVRGEGCFLYDDKGRAFLDMTGGSGAVNLGHQRPEIIENLTQQAGRLLHTGWNIDNPYRHRMIKRLAQLMPFDEAAVMGGVTGAEAIEIALKITRAKTGRETVVYFGNAYHGKTQGALSVTDNAAFRRHLAAGGRQTLRVDMAECYGGDPAACMQWAEDLDRHLARLTREDQLPAAMIVEPVQGAEGILVVPEPVLRAIVELGKAHGVLTIFDEIYTGFGRLGQPFAATRALCPDLVVIGKSLGNGVPVSAVVGHPEIVNTLGYAAHSSTFTFSPLVCVVAERVIDLHVAERPWENAVKAGRRIRQALTHLARQDARISNIRGRGLMLAFDCADPTLDTPTDAACHLGRTLEEAGVIVRTGGVSKATVKLTPPLILSEPEIRDFLDKLTKALGQIPTGSTSGRALTGVV